jgi:protein-tyrosine phosphatase
VAASDFPRADHGDLLGWPGVVDLHCHILPGIDDGALDLADSLAMARVAAGDGIEVVAATPHIRHDHDVRIAELTDRVTELNRALKEAGVPVTVVTGGELAETALDGLDGTELRKVSLGGRGWILLEPRPGPLGRSLIEAIRRLRDAGFRVLVAHPERHISADLPDRIRETIEAGALVQVTAAFLAGGPAREGMLSLARRGLIHIVSSDAHSSHRGRPLRLSEGLRALEEIETVRSYLDWIAVQAPKAILRGDQVEPPYAPV